MKIIKVKAGAKSINAGKEFKVPVLESYQDIDTLGIDWCLDILNRSLRQHFYNLADNFINFKVSDKDFQKELQNIKSNQTGMLTLKRCEELLDKALQNGDINEASKQRKYIKMIKNAYAERVSRRKALNH